MLLHLDDNLWVDPRPLRFLGAEVGTRMTVIRLEDGSLFLHSPVQLDQPTKADIDELGLLRFVVAPNRFHHLFVADYIRAYPEAKFYGAPGLDLKRKDLRFDAILDDAPPADGVGRSSSLSFAPSHRSTKWCSFIARRVRSS